jgi:hypothetical protein
MDGVNNYATMHVVSSEFSITLKKKIKEELSEYGINHVTIEFEEENEVCDSVECKINNSSSHHHHNHHHHH